MSLRVTPFRGDNSAPATSPQKLGLELRQDIEVGLGTSANAEGPLLALVNVVLRAAAKTSDGTDTGAIFEGRYEGKFEYPAGVTEELIGPRFATEPYPQIANNESMVLKPQDLLVALKLVALGSERWTYLRLAKELGLSASEAYAGVQRCLRSSLL